jgi:type II secretory pathway pseudopilin PulG
MTLRRSESGMSIVDLLVALAVMSVIAAVAVPNIQAAGDGYELVTAGFDVAAKLGEARTNALKRNRQTWVLITAATQTLQLQMVDAGTGNPVDIGGPEFLPRRVEVLIPGGAATQQILFDAMGRPVDGVGIVLQQAVQIRHIRSTQTRTVTAGTTGRITVN